MEETRRATRASNLSPSSRLRSGGESSPAQRKSPTRTKIPARAKSPARRKSPARTKSPPRSPKRVTKSPSRGGGGGVAGGRTKKDETSAATKLPETKSAFRASGERRTLPNRQAKEIKEVKEVFESEKTTYSIRRTLTPTTVVTTKRDEETQKEEKTTFITKPFKVNMTSLKLGSSLLDGPLSKQSISTSRSSSTIQTSSSTETQEIGSNNQKDTSGDSEIIKITSVSNAIPHFLNARRSVSKTFTPTLATHNLTPTPTTAEMSRRSRSVSHSTYNDDNYSRSEYSDEESEQFESFNTDATKATVNLAAKSYVRQAPKEFGGAIGAALLLLLIPCITFYLQYTCDQTACKFETVDYKNLFSRATLLKITDYKTASSYILYTFGIFVLSTLPVGRYVRFYSDRGCIDYNFNSIFVLAITLASLLIAEYLKYNPIEFIMKNYTKYCFLNLTSALVLSLWMFVRSRYVSQHLWNPYAKSGRFFTDFFAGREINPRWFDFVDIKLVQYRTCLISSAVLCVSLFYKNLKISGFTPDNGLSYIANITHFAEHIKYDTTSLIATCLVLVYVLDWVVYENHLTSSFEFQYEGVGAQLLLRYAATPFLWTIIPKYLYDHQPVNVPSWVMSLAVVVFAVGLLLKRSSNKLKYEYRLHPNDSKTTFLESIPTYQGKRLLLSGWWGTIRNPNYLGDILSLLSLTTPLFWQFAWPPFICVLLLVTTLLHRTTRANARNATKYTSSWVRYCSRVPYYLIRKVY